MACVVKANQKSKSNEMHKEKPEITTNGAESAVEGRISSHDELEIELNKESKAVVCDRSPEGNTAPVTSLVENEQPLNYQRVTSNVVIDENQSRSESIQTFVNAEENDSLKHAIEQVNSSHSDKNVAGEDCHDEEVDENNGCDRKSVDDTDFLDPVAENGLEEKPAGIEDSKNEDEVSHVIKVMNEEKPAVSSIQRTSPDNSKTEKISDDFGDKIVPVTIDKDPDITSHDTSRIRDHDDITVSGPLHEVTLKEPTTSASGEIVESKTSAERTIQDYPSKENDDFDYGFAAFNDKTEHLPAAFVPEEKPVIKSKERPGLVPRARAQSEQRSGTESALASQDIASALRSGSLENLKLYHQHDDTAKSSRPSRLTYSPPTNSRSPVGHLRREKRPARMLRNTSFDVVCDIAYRLK